MQQQAGQGSGRHDNVFAGKAAMKRSTEAGTFAAMRLRDVRDELQETERTKDSMRTAAPRDPPGAVPTPWFWRTLAAHL